MIAAQRAPHALVDAVEIDAASARQAQENAAASPWSDRIRIHHMDVRRLRTATPFDRIISNPPFHTTHSPSRTIAVPRPVTAALLPSPNCSL
ncbi:MAG: methyltransferase [Flavobacteriales bacterium]|nr:methyltransferase [Flavobacteriales bacterium]